MNLVEVKKILCDFKESLSIKKNIRDSLGCKKFDLVSDVDEMWKKDEARCWIHCTDRIYPLVSYQNKLSPKNSKAAMTPAKIFYCSWQQAIEKEANPDTFYHEYFVNKEEFSNYHLQEPKEEETLRDYIIRLRDFVESNGTGLYYWYRGLMSFLNFLRQTLPEHEIAFLEWIFPEEMETRETKIYEKVNENSKEFQYVKKTLIIRRISSCEYPIYITNIADILKALVDKVLNGRSDGQHTAAETLGLCWLCLISAQMRLPTSVKYLIDIPATKLIESKEGEFPELSMPSFFGYHSTSISENIFNYLKALSAIPSDKPRTSIFQKTRESLYVCLGRTISQEKIDAKLGKITFLTFLSIPHEFGEGYR